MVVTGVDSMIAGQRSLEDLVRRRLIIDGQVLSDRKGSRSGGKLKSTGEKGKSEQKQLSLLRRRSTWASTDHSPFISSSTLSTLSPPEAPFFGHQKTFPGPRFTEQRNPPPDNEL
ncbi:hypothetical protein E4U28_007857 [Claviceps purpurea]|nr:hypothetical protein E4U28_007857 [Claviceps purpurea]